MGKTIPLGKAAQGLWFTAEPKEVTDGDVPGLNATIIDYKYLIVPLTLLSAYLLLMKPRPAKPKPKST